MQVKVREKGQITLPKEVREQIGVKPGENLTVLVVDGEVRMRPVIGVVARTYGMFSHLAEANQNKSIDQILAEEESAIEQGMLEDFTKSEQRH
jgi:AbrB family looped-hinge helix DNA binding protein